MRNRILASVCLIIGLNGCTQALVTDPVVVSYPAITLPQPSPMVLNPVQWRVYNQDSLKKYSMSMKDDDVLIGLSASDYDNLNLNLVEIKRYLEEQKALINAYKNIEDLRSKDNTKGK